MSAQLASYGIQRPRRRLGPPPRHQGDPLDDQSQIVPAPAGEQQPSQTTIQTMPAAATPDGKSVQAPDMIGAAETDYANAVNAVPQKMPRWKAALQMLAYGLGRAPTGDTWQAVAGQVGSAGGSALAGAINPKLPGEIKKGYNIDRSYSRLKQVETIENSRSTRAAREAAATYKTKRLAQFDSAAQEKSRFNDWRIQSGDRKADQYGDWLEWRKANGDAQQHTRDDFLQWRQEAESRVDSDRDREYGRRVNQDKFNNELHNRQLELMQKREERLKSGGSGGQDTSEEEVSFWSNTADIYKNNADTAADSRNDEEEATYRALERSARIKSGEAAAHGIRTRGKTGAAGAKPKDPLGLFP